MLVAHRSKVSLILVGIPALAGLSALHGLVPPHPGPLIAIDALNANLGMTLGLGLLVAIPTVAISGPLLARPMNRWVPLPPPESFLGEARKDEGARRPAFATALTVVLLPVVLMLARTIAESLGVGRDGPPARCSSFIGTPLVALLITSLVALVAFGTGARTHPRRGQRAGRGVVRADRRHPAHRRRGRRLQADARRLGHRRRASARSSPTHPSRRCWPAGSSRCSSASRPGRRRSPRSRPPGIVAPLAADLSTSHVALLVLAIGAARCSSATSTTPGSGWSRSTSA